MMNDIYILWSDIASGSNPCKCMIETHRLLAVSIIIANYGKTIHTKTLLSHFIELPIKANFPLGF